MPVPAAANALTTLTAVKDFGGISGTSQDDKIQRIINAVSADLQRWLCRDLGRATVDNDNPEQHQGHGHTVLRLRRLPIVSVQAVRIDGSAVTNFSQNAHFDQKGWIYREARWTSRMPRFDDVTADPDPLNRAWNIEVEYVAGFVLPDDPQRDLPYDVEQVVIDSVLGHLKNPGAGRETKSETLPGGASVQWAAPLTPAERRAAYVTLRPFQRCE